MLEKTLELEKIRYNSKLEKNIAEHSSPVWPRSADGGALGTTGPAARTSAQHSCWARNIHAPVQPTVLVAVAKRRKGVLDIHWSHGIRSGRLPVPPLPRAARSLKLIERSRRDDR